MLGYLNILLQIRNSINEDMKLYPNYYWNLNYDLIKGILIINPILDYTYDKVIFMGEVLFKDCGSCNYLSELYNKYPIKITFTTSEGCIIEVDEAKLRKNKINNLLNG